MRRANLAGSLLVFRWNANLFREPGVSLLECPTQALYPENQVGAGVMIHPFDEDIIICDVCHRNFQSGFDINYYNDHDGVLRDVCVYCQIKHRIHGCDGCDNWKGYDQFPDDRNWFCGHCHDLNKSMGVTWDEWQLEMAILLEEQTKRSF